MSEHVEHRPKPPRFPYVAAALCAACVGAAAWTWMRYSYRWLLTPSQFCSAFHEDSDVPAENWGRKAGRFVTVAGFITTYWEHIGRPFPADQPTPRPDFIYVGLSDTKCRVDVRMPPEIALAWPQVKGEHRVYAGRVVHDYAFCTEARPVPYAIDVTASRFTGASIAGLVVGAMGVFVFMVALRHWVRERRAAA